MKMKSKLFGLGAKMALALLAVGMTVTSCYDSENVDIIQPDQPVAPKYYIAGNITDAETGDIVTNATVTIDGDEVTLTNGAFNKEVSVGDAGASFVVAVVADGYRDVSRTIFFPAMGNGTVTVGNADFALVGVTASDLLEEDPLQDNYPVSDEEYTLLKDELGNVLPESVVLTTDEDGNIVATYAAEEVTNSAIGEDLEITAPYYSGFASTISQDADDIFTKALTDGQIWNASASNVLGLPYGLTLGERSVILPGRPGCSISTWTLTQVFAVEPLSFGGVVGTVTYQSNWVITFSYESHDGHDWHDNHGSVNGAGGGNGNMGY